ncbi:MAG: shikimate kinase [Actinobacteria bacterium HGW-Actinobacteria-7]|nr:MAG: shikimate kinase [Actinobacteria bacterium HGW-Actinobacteria-7]
MFLVGFMGAGKSTVAQVVAAALQRPCVDLDSQIEAGSHRPVSQIFAEDGEEGFRDQESQALTMLEGQTPAVVACGGGVVLRTQNRALLKRLGTVVYLVVTAEEAVARVGDSATRPLLAGSAGSLAATSLLAAREGLYRSVADVVVDTVGRTSEQVAAQVISELDEVEA